MSLLQRILVLLSVFALVAASVTVSMASVLEVAGTMDAGMSADASPDAMPGCADCGRNAVPASACALHCMVPPADIAVAAILLLLPDPVPVATAVSGFAGRAPAPDLHPPRGTA